MAGKLLMMQHLLMEAKKKDDAVRRRQAHEIRQMTLMSRESDIIKNYRLSPDLVQTLESELQPHLPTAQRSDAINCRMKILYSLHLLAFGDYQHGVGQNVETYVSQPTGSKILHQFLDAITQKDIVSKYIRFPQNMEERNVLRIRFYEKFRIPGMLGSVDGTLVAMVRPKEREELFYCRKGYHARNVMVISDADLNILHVDATFGGATHDSFVFNNSPIKPHLEELNHNGEVTGLLGDSGYPQRAYLMTPFKNPRRGSPEELYNKLHGSARNSVERTFGVLKGRFRCLLTQKALQYDPITVSKIIIACCVLHNMCNRVGLPAPSLTQEEEEVERSLQRMLAMPRPQFDEDGLELGRTGRAHLANQLWRAQHH